MLHKDADDDTARCIFGSILGTKISQEDLSTAAANLSNGYDNVGTQMDCLDAFMAQVDAVLIEPKVFEINRVK